MATPTDFSAWQNNPQTTAPAKQLVWPKITYFILLTLTVLPFLATADFFNLFSPHTGTTDRILLSSLPALYILALILATSTLNLTKVPSLWIFVIAFGFFCCVFSQFPRYALMEWAICSILILAYIAVTNSKLDPELLIKWYLVSILASITLYNYSYTDSYLSTLCLVKSCMIGYAPDFDNQRHFSLYQTSTLLILPLLSSITQGKARFLAIFSCGIWFSLFLSIETRSSWLSCAIGLIIILITLRKQALVYLKALSSLVFIGTIIYGIFHIAAFSSLFSDLPNNTGVRHATDTGSILARFRHWGNAWQLSVEHPVFGTGARHYSLLVESQKWNEAAHPHNLWLQITSEWGVIIGSLIVFTTLKFAKETTHIILLEKDSRKKLIIAVFFSSWIACLIEAQFYRLSYSHFIILGIIITSLTSKNQEFTKKGNKYLISAVLGISIYSLSNSIYPDALCRAEENQSFFKKTGEYLHPNWWNQGRIGFSAAYESECKDIAKNKLLQIVN